MNGEQIKLFRLGRGWSQQFLASRLGVNQATVCRLESRAKPPSGPIKLLLEKIMQEKDGRGASQ